MTILEIKLTMTEAFIADKTIIGKYGLEEGKTFEEQFSPASIESILFYIVAAAMWLNIQLFEQYKIDLLKLLQDNKAHTPGWYATRAKQFQYGYDLAGETDLYNNEGLTDEQIETARIIKFSAAVEASDSSVLFVKVANETNNIKHPITAQQLQAFTAYLYQIKDAGVRITIINAPADDLRLKIDIYYNPLILDNSGRRLDGSDEAPIPTAIRDYVSNLAFNGMYINQALIDRLQKVQGVDIAELKEASYRYGEQVNYTLINARSIPYAGYYQVTNNNMILNFIANG